MNHKDSGNEKGLEQEFQGYAQLLTTAEAVAQQQGDEEMAIELYQLMTVLKNGGDMLNQLSKYKDEVQDIQKQGEFMRIIGKLNLELANAEIALAQQLREAQKLEDKILELERENKELKNPSVTLVMIDGLYYKEGDEVPFCPNCYDSTGKLSRMTDVGGQLYTCSSENCGYKKYLINI
jgi:hypothetical protein